MKVNTSWLYCGLSCLALALLVTGTSSMESKPQNEEERRTWTIPEDVDDSKLPAEVEKFYVVLDENERTRDSSPALPLGSNDECGRKRPLTEPADDLESLTEGVTEEEPDWSDLMLDQLDVSDIPAINVSHPILVLIGVTGMGKSALGNMLGRIGNPQARNVFDEGIEMESKTKFSRGAMIHPEKSPMFVIDNPGLLDNKGRLEDDRHREEVVKFLMKHKKKNRKFGVNTFAMIINSGNARSLDIQDQKTILEYVNMFGPDFLNHLVFVFRSWPYQKSVVADIEESGDDENRYFGQTGMEEATKMIRETLHDCLQKADLATHESQVTIDISQATLNRVKTRGVPCFFVDSKWDAKDSEGPLFEEDEREQAANGAAMFLNHVKKSRKYPCLPWQVNPRYQSELTKKKQEEEKEKARVQENRQKLTKAKEDAEVLQEESDELDRELDEQNRNDLKADKHRSQKQIDDAAERTKKIVEQQQEVKKKTDLKDQEIKQYTEQCARDAANELRTRRAQCVKQVQQYGDSLEKQGIDGTVACSFFPVAWLALPVFGTRIKCGKAVQALVPRIKNGEIHPDKVQGKVTQCVEAHWHVCTFDINTSYI